MWFGRATVSDLFFLEPLGHPVLSTMVGLVHRRSRRLFHQESSDHNWLVVWNMFYFSIYWECHHPNWRTPSFVRGVGIPPENVNQIFLNSVFLYLVCILWELGPDSTDGQPKKKLRYILAGTMLLSSIIMLTKSLGRRMLSDIFFLVFFFVGALGFGLLGFASQVYVAGENWAATWCLNTLPGPAKRKIFRYPRG